MRQVLSATLFAILLAIPWIAVLDGGITPAAAGVLSVVILAAAFLGASIFRAVRSLLFLVNWSRETATRAAEYRGDLRTRRAQSIRERYNLEADDYTHKVLLALVLTLIAIITALAEIALVADSIFGRQVEGPVREIGFLQHLQQIAYDYAAWLYALIMVCCFASAHLLHNWLDLGNSETPELRNRSLWAMRTGFVLSVLTTLLFGLDWLLANHSGVNESTARALEMPAAPITDVSSILDEMQLAGEDGHGIDALEPAPLPAEGVYSGWAFSVAISLLRFAAIAMLAALMAPFAFLLGQAGPLLTTVWILLIGAAWVILGICTYATSVVYVVLHFAVGLPIRFVQFVAAPLAEKLPAADNPADFRESFETLARRGETARDAGAADANEVDVRPVVGPDEGRPDARNDDGDEPGSRQADPSWSPFR